jgi:hypothetical protein
LQEFLDQSGVTWRVLEEHELLEAQQHWRSIYGEAFRDRPRLRVGVKAELEYAEVECGRYLVVPFIHNVAGLPIQVAHRRTADAYECFGKLIPLGDFHSTEFFISPPDFAWSMIHTHEDHAYGGPYFIRAEWIP